MPKDFSKWIEHYNKAKGWQTIVVAKGVDGASARSPARELRKLQEEATAQELKLAKELGELDATIIDLVRKVRDEKRDLEKFRLENDLKIAQKKHAEVSNRHDIASELTLKRGRLLAQIKELDKNIRQSIRGIHREIDQIKTNPAQDTPKGHDSRKEYDSRRLDVVSEIDRARSTLITLRDPNLDDTKRYSGISSTEYTLLHTMLFKGDAYADVGNAPEGMKILDAVLDKLDKMVKARKGVLLAEIAPERNPEVSTPVAEAQQCIAAIRAAGLGKLADRLSGRLDLLDRQFEEGKAGLSLGLKLEDLVRPHLDFALECKQKVGHIPEFRKAVEEMASLVGELRVLGDDDSANYTESVWNNHEQSSDIPREIKFVQTRIEILREAIRLLRDEKLGQENVDPTALREKFDKIKKSVEEMFKHHGDGSRKTQTDTNSQQKKDVSKDKKVPRDALDEINVRLKMADILLESNSVDALKRAGKLLDDISTFQTDVKENSDNYEIIEKGIEILKSDFQVFYDRYMPYLADRRSEFKIATDAFAKDYKKQDPKTNTAKLRELNQISADIRLQVTALKTVRKKFNAEEAKLQKEIETFGKIFVAAKLEHNGKKVKGYWGKLVKDMEEARKTAEKSDKENLTEALVKLDAVRLELTAQTEIVKKWFKPAERLKMTLDQENEWFVIRDDVFSGQDRHDENVKAEKQWKKDYPAFKKRLEKIKDDFKDLKLEMSDIEVALLDLDALATEQKVQPDYVSALERLQDMGGTATALENRAKELKTFKAEPVDKAAKIACDQLRAFLAFIDTFDDDVRKADPDADTKYDLTNLAAYLNLVRDAVPSAAITRLENLATELAKDTSLSNTSRQLRESALAEVRLIMGRMRTSTAIKHFAAQTFAADETRVTALAALDRLQVKLLTALK